MTDALAIQATYVDWKRIKTRAQYQLIFEVPEEQFDEVMRVLGAPHFEKWVGIAPLNPVKLKWPEEISFPDLPKNPDLKTYGKQAEKLVLCGFFKHKEVWEAVGSDEDYLEWIRTQPSAISGGYDQTEVGNRCEACHVRRANNSGTGIKPKYSAVPLTHEEHQLQHQKGELALLMTSSGHLHLWDEKGEFAKDWFDAAALKHVSEWAKIKLKEALGVTSLKYLEPSKLYEWCKSRNLDIFLPREYKHHKEVV